MLLVEELVLLGLHPERGMTTNGSGRHVRLAAPGMLLIDLVADGLIVLSGRRFVGTGLTTPDPLQAEAITAVAKDKRVLDQLAAVDRKLYGVRERVLTRLLDTGVVEKVKKGRLSPTAHPVRRRDVYDALLLRLQEAASGDAEMDPRTARLLLMTGPTRLLEVVAPVPPRKHARQRIDNALEHTTLEPAEKEAVEALMTATRRHIFDETTSSD